MESHSQSALPVLEQEQHLPALGHEQGSLGSALQDLDLHREVSAGSESSATVMLVDSIAALRTDGQRCSS